MGAMNMVVYSKNDTNVPAESVGAPPSPPSRRGTAKTHTATVVMCTANISAGQKVVQ
jgi:hypothetical protein